MAFKQEEFDSQKVAEFLKDTVIKIKTEEDPVVLNQLKKIFKQEVPFTLRMYTAAYLTKLLAGGAKRPGRYERERFKKRGEDQLAPRTPRVTIDEALASTIFISVGRNRRVFPRDLITLLVTAAEIERERIGEIRVLDNYSFIQVFSEDAEKIIERLNGSDYRGRKLSVSYSRKKDENSDDFAENDDEMAADESSMMEEQESSPLV